MMPSIDRDWTLFLDRDGVLNHDNRYGYILNTSQFRFYDDALAALKILSGKFKTLVVVTNQRGVGKELMSQQDLENIHRFMNDQIIKAGGRIDKVYSCTDADDNSPDRKPQTGMAMKAKKDFPHIDFKRSIMVGNKLSDMQFGKNAGMFTVFLETTDPEVSNPHPLIDARYKSLMDFVKSL